MQPEATEGGALGPVGHGSLGAEHGEAFLARFGGSVPPRVFFSPGRVNLIGSHLDYNGGPVLPTAIDRGTFVALRERSDGLLRLASSLGDPAALELSLEGLPGQAQGSWSDYPIGVVRELLRDHPGPHPGLDIYFGGNLPVGAGLSSSASICVGTAFALSSTWGLASATDALVAAALRAEREYVGVHCGIMDPYAIGFARPGHLLWLDCKDQSYEHLPLDFRAVSIAVADTGVRRELAQGEFNRRVAECAKAFEVLGPRVPGATCLRDVPGRTVETYAGDLEPEVARRARHVAGEVERTFAARTALETGDLARFGELMSEAHASLRELYEVSCDELDVLVDAGLEAEGVLGARLTGAGFGGCAVLLMRRGAEERASAHVAERFEGRFGRRPRIEFFAGDEGPRELT